MFYVDRFNDTVGIGNKDAVVAAKKAYDEALLKYMLDNKDKVFVINDGDAFHTHNGAACLVRKDMPMDTYECNKSYGRIVAWRDTDGGHRYPTFRMVHLDFCNVEKWGDGGCKQVPAVVVSMGEYDGYSLLKVASSEDFGGYVEDNSKLDKFVYDSLFEDMAEFNGRNYLLMLDDYLNNERPWKDEEGYYVQKERMSPELQEAKWANLGWRPFAGED